MRRRPSRSTWISLESAVMAPIQVRLPTGRWIVLVAQKSGFPGYSRKAFPWYSGKLPQGEKVSEESLQAALAYKPREKRLNKPNLTEAGP